LGISNIRSGLKARLETISSLRIFETWPEAVNQLPAAVIGLEGGEYNAGIGCAKWRFRITILVQRADLPGAQAKLDPYLDEAGAQSIAQIIEADRTLGGLQVFAQVMEMRDYGGHDYADSKYFGANVIVEVQEV